MSTCSAIRSRVRYRFVLFTFLVWSCVGASVRYERDVHVLGNTLKTRGHGQNETSQPLWSGSVDAREQGIAGFDLGRTSAFRTVPVVLFALNEGVSGTMAHHGIPLMCAKNNQVIVLTNVDHGKLLDVHCVEMVNVEYTHNETVMQMPWRENDSSHRKSYFDRWYILRDWMMQTQTMQVLAIDGNVIITEDISKFVASNSVETLKHDLWVANNPARSSQAVVLLTYRALKDVTSFWNRIFQPDIWTSEIAKEHLPNEMLAMGYYLHVATGENLPCKGNNSKNTSDICNTHQHGHIAEFLKRVAQKGVRAHFPPGALGISRGGIARFPQGVIDDDRLHDSSQQYEMSKEGKQLRFWRGQAQLKLRSQWWMFVWGYIIDDGCFKHHAEHILKKHTCNCENWCCGRCQPVDSGLDDDLTVWSVWRNDTDVHLSPHLRFYLNYWRAERLFLNVGYDNYEELSGMTQVLSELCGPVHKSGPVHEDTLSGALLTSRHCGSGQEIITLAYKAENLAPSAWNAFTRTLKSLYMEHYDATKKKMYIDCDEYFVPAFGDVASARQMNNFNYHMVMIKPHAGKRNWSRSFEWVDQPYYYRIRAMSPSGTKFQSNYAHDGNEPLETLNRISHNGPFAEHKALNLATKISPDAYKNTLRLTHTMYHMSVPSEEIFVSVKRFDQTTADGSRNGDIRRNFENYFLTPERDFMVFEDNYLYGFFQNLTI